MQVIKTIPGNPDFHLFESLPAELYPTGNIRLQQKENINKELLHQCYVLVDNNKTVARAALYNNADLFFEGKKTTCIGNYECADDLSYSTALLTAIINDAKNLGSEYIIGPMNGSTWDDYRFALNHHRPPFFMEPFHPLYYNTQFAGFGFQSVAHYVSGISDCANYKPASAQAFEKLYEKGLQVRAFDLNDFDKELEKLYSFCMLAFKNNFLYTPISFQYFKEKYAAAKKIITPDFFRIAENNDGNVVGFIFCTDDLYNKKEKSLIIKTVARYPGEKWKGMTNLTADMVYTLARDKGYKKILHAFMHENNASISISKNFNASVFRQYALYGRNL